MTFSFKSMSNVQQYFILTIKLVFCGGRHKGARLHCKDFPSGILFCA